MEKTERVRRAENFRDKNLKWMKKTQWFHLIFFIGFAGLYSYDIMYELWISALINLVWMIVMLNVIRNMMQDVKKLHKYVEFAHMQTTEEHLKNIGRIL